MNENNALIKTDKKNKKLVLLFTIIAIVLVIGSGIFVCYKKGIIFGDKNTTKNKVKNELTEKDLNNIFAYKALKYSVYLNPNRKDITSFTNNDLVAIFQSYYSADENNYKLIKDYDTSEEELDGSIYEIKVEEILSFIKKTFGPNASINPSILVGADTEIKGIDMLLLDYDNIFDRADSYFLCGFKVDAYDENTKKYTVTSYPGCGTGADYELLDKTVKFVKAVKKNDELTITLNALYDDCDDNFVSDEKITCKIYSDYRKKNQVGKKSVDFGKHISFKEYESKASTITIKLKLDDATKEYYFVSSSVK